jgi:drug/metabolite transporter (DMT)-like permease
MYIILTILSSWWLLFVFKYFEKYNISQIQTIVFNYIVCTALSGAFCYEKSKYLSPNEPWFIGAALLGIFFILLFNLMAFSTTKVGISTTTVSTKLSLVIPVFIGFALLGDQFSISKIVGLLLALIAIVFITITKNKDAKTIENKYLLLPVVLFVWNGINDSIISYCKDKYITTNTSELFTFTIFGTACVIGICWLSYLLMIKKEVFNKKNILVGIILGIPNFFSIHFLLKALESKAFNNSEIYTIVNIGIVLLGVMSGILFFKEKLKPQQLVGVALALVAIVLIALY